MSTGNEAPAMPPGAYNEGIFSHTEGRSRTLFITAILLPIFCAPIIILRFWTSIKIVGKWHKDDTLAVIATIFCVLHSIIVCVEARLGVGSHIWEINPEGMGLWIRVLGYGGVPLYNLNTLFIKTTILAFYLRFSIDRAFRIVTYAVTVVVVIYSLISALGPTIFPCTTGVEPGCPKVSKVHLTSACFNIATDFLILPLPLWLLQPMKVSWGRKAGIAVGLMAGGFVAAISIIRLLAVLDVSEGGDLPFKVFHLVLWSLIEAWCGLVCACLPCIKAFFSRYFPSFILLGSSYGSGSTRQLATIRVDDDTIPDVEMQQSYSSRLSSDLMGRQGSKAS